MGIQIVEHGNKQDFLWNAISRTETLVEIGDYEYDKITLFFKRRQEKEGSGNTVYNVMKYIRNNFQNESLSIKEISEYTFLTPNYLCLIFKKETEKTINQYVTEVRIEKAKEFLKGKEKVRK